MAETLTSTLNQPFSATGAIGRIMSPSGIEERSTAARREIPSLIAEEQAGFAEERRAAQEARKQGARAVARAEREFATRTGEAISEFDRTMPQRPEFEPTQFDAGSAAVTAGLVGLLGAFGSRGRGRAALKSMLGWVDGANQGQKDVYNRELKDFEQNLSAWKDNMTIAKDRLVRIMDQYGRDKNAALVEAKLLETELGDGVIAAQIRQNNPKKALEYANAALKLGDDVKAAVAKTLAKNEVAKVPTDIDKNLRKIGDVSIALNDLSRNLKKGYFRIAPITAVAEGLMKAVEVDLDPTVVAFIKEKYGVTEDQINWWKQYNSFKAEVRNKLFGATLTGREQADFERFNITPATSQDQAEKFFQNQLRIVSNGLAKERAIARSRGISDDIIDAYFGLESGQRPAQQAQNVDKAALRAQAQKAIADGKDEDAVKARYKNLTGEDY